MIIISTAKLVFSEPVSRFMNWLLPFENLELAGYFKNETAWGFADEHDELQKLKNIVDFKANYRFADWLEFFTDIRTWYDALYDIEGRFRDVVYKEKNIRLRMPVKLEWLRECYFDIFTPRVDLRLGKQYVVWGTTDGVRILDKVNPIDLREWTLKDFTDLRIPLWMLKAESEVISNGFLQLLLIPDYEPNYFSPAGAPFALRTTIAGAESAANPYINVSTISNEPERTAENIKVGLRWRKIVETGFFSGLEYTLNYLHTYDSAMSYYVWLKPKVPPTPPFQLELTRNAEGIDIFGGSFAKSITKGIMGSFGKGWTIRGEFAYIKGGAMNYGPDYSIKGTVDVDQYNYALGFDKTFFTDWLFSFQFIQMIANSLEEYDKDQYTLLFGPTRGPLDKVETLLTVKLSTDFMHERLKPEILVIYGDDNDWRISPKVSFEINDNLIVAGGVHIFEGDPQQMHGQFDDNDQIFIETTYSW
jgi:hypothetical protein